MDGSVLQLRDSEGCNAVSKDECGPAAAPTDGSTRAVSAGSELTDLYEGLSDIDDIYGVSSATCDVTGNGQGIYEVDLGLDEDDYGGAPALVKLDPAAPAPLSSIN